MPDHSEISRPSQLWKQLAADRKQRAAEAFWKDEDAVAEQGEAIATIAQRIKFRLRSVVAMPIEKKARYLSTMSGVSELVAARLLVAYHLAHHRPMMAAFLDGLGISHEDGLIADENLQAPSEDRLQAAVNALSASYPAEDVELYFSTLLWQDPETWGGLSKQKSGKVENVEK